MYLKELDLHGFKSFPDKVKLEFNKGITAVVGPNGSGKSNISDAVKWVLGEQRAKSLRGGKMEDVIFSGTANRRPVGFAEVSMTIDNADKKIPVDYSEITVTRRVYRSGESGYFINGTECRLKDIYELFMDTGIGRDGYSIIGQGKIDEILSNKSEDRRQLFEEAAGIVKYKNRRAEAEGKLEKEHQNLLRVTDIISEIEGKIEPLEKQADKARKYLELYEEMKEADIALFAINGKRLEEDAEKIKALMENNSAVMEKNDRRLEELAGEASGIKNAVAALDAESGELNRAIAGLSGEIERNEGLRVLTGEQTKNLREAALRYEEENKTKRESVEKNNGEITALREAIDAEARNMEEISAEIDRRQEELRIMLNEQSEYEEKTENYKSEMIERIKLTADLKGTMERTDAVIEQFEERKKQLVSEREKTERSLREKKISLNSARLRLEETEDEIEEAGKKIKRLESKREGVLKVISVIDEGIRDKSSKLSEKGSRLKVLSAMEKEHDGYYKSVKAILQLSSVPSFKGVKGAVAQLFKTDEKYETAIETALGGSMQSIVVENENDARTAVNYLKEHRLGRATFLPVSTVKGRTLGAEKDALLSEKGVIAAAVDLVKFDREYTGIAESLLGRIIVMDGMDNAIAFARKHKQSYRLVTVEGESFMPGGAITGGSLGKKDGGVFGRKREIETLKAETAALEAACGGLNAERERNAEKADEIAEDMEEASNSLKQLEFEKISASGEAAGIERETAEYEERLKLSAIEEKQLEEQLEKARLDRAEAAEKLDRTEKEILELQETLNKYKETAESGKSGSASASEKITELRVRLSSLTEKNRAREGELDRLKSDNDRLESEIRETEENRAETETRIALKEAEAEEAAKAAERARDEKKQKEKMLLDTSDDRAKKAGELEKKEEEINGCRETALKYKNEQVRLETRSERLAEEIRRLNDDMWENYGITFPEALERERPEAPLGELSSKVKELKAKIRELGTVNVNAVDEYRETKERYDFLSGQKADIMDAEEKLKGIIKDLSGLMERQFRENLEIISENFGEVFREMFGGGRAYLKVLDEDDILGSGIDIIAQPPGKNLQNMMLLSGGERALTAIAILFSILKMKPSPFCILDEIEAALDDANVQRFGDYLRRFSDDTQFIVITHRKGTMEAADVLYGVTMQEQGVSKIVSVKFDEAVIE